MTRHLHILITITAASLGLLTVAHAAEKWSRQLEPSAAGVADTFDWVPVAQPVDGTAKDRSANARVLTYSQSFPPNARFGVLPKPLNPPSTQQHQPFDFPFQFQRFGNAPSPPPPQHHRLQSSSPFGGSPLKASHSLQSGEPTSQSFFKFEMPYRSDAVNRGVSGSPGSVQTGYQIQHTFGGGGQASLFNSPLFNQQPVFPPEFHPLPQKPLQQSLQQRPLPQQNFIEDSFAAKNTFRESKPEPTQQALQSVTPQVFPSDPSPEALFELNKPTTFQAQSPFQQAAHVASSSAETAPTSSGAGQQDVQLLYVPYDTLYNQQKPNSAFEVNKYNVNPGLPTVNPYQINQFYTQDSLGPIEQNFYTTSTTSRPQTTSLKPTTIFQNFAAPPLTTAKPKPKAHQPPLAMFLVRSSTRPTQAAVVATLRNANTISVIDAPTKQIPQIFVGPGGMPTPDGYVKFDLPYLSQLTQTRDLHDVPFFVAPLSYRTPNGFNKILLPEPHVGSIVINLSRGNIQEEVAPQSPQPNVVYSPNDVGQYHPPPTQRVRPHRVKQPSIPKEYYNGDVLQEPNQNNRDPYEVTTQRATLSPSRGNKFSYFYNQDAIHEVTSPKINKHDRPKKKRPHNVQVEQPAFTQTINNPYAQFKPVPNQIVGDDIYKVQTTRPSSTSTSTSTTTTTTSTTSTTTPPPTTLFAYNTSPQVQYQSANGQLYPNLAPAAEAPADVHVPRFTARPPPSTAAEEEYRMKQYFRQQDAFRNRPQTVNPTNPPFEQVQYTPVDLDYDREVSIPSTTHRTTSTTKQRVTFYTPTTAPATLPEEAYNTVPTQPQIIEIQHEKDTQVELKPNRKSPVNHRPSYNQNEIPDSTVEYDPNPYQLPSELPPLTPNLPGLVNNLQEKDKQGGIEQGATAAPTQNNELPTRPTRRPINRVRKPVVSKVTSSVSYSESETSTRRPPQRVRRPFGSRGTASAATSLDNEAETTSTTRRPTSAARNPLLRNPNRIRYQPTNEERQSLRTKHRKKNGDSRKGNDDEDLDYQRDVLKQNYPVIKPLSSRTPTSPTAIPSSYASVVTTEGPTSESQQVYTVTPSNSVDNNEQTFPAGLLEPMQIAQQYSKYTKDNYGPGYFPNQEELSPTEPVIRNEISPVFTTAATTRTITTTTTTEEPQVTTRRSPFIRRNYPRLRSTTTETPTTTTPATEMKSTRARIPPRKVIKVRARTRRPLHPASSTTAPEEAAEEEAPKNNLRKINRFNHDLYENDTPKRRYRPSFHLDGQESQWSPPLKTGNNHHFKPSNLKDATKANEHKFEEEPEIVTIGPDDETRADNFEVKVSANLGSANTLSKPMLKAANLKPEKSFAELLEEVMGKAPEEKPLESVEETNMQTTDGTYFESQKTTIGSRINRRNKFKNLSNNAHNNESFETAESQNLGAQLYNSLHNKSGQEKTTDEMVKDFKTSTPLTPTTDSKISITMATTTPTPMSTMDGYELTTSKQSEATTIPTTAAMNEVYSQTTTTPTDVTDTTTEESATRRMDEAIDDLESQPSIFSEVKKQLHELFAIDDSDDQAVTAALAAVGKRRQEYTNIKRTKPDTTTQAMDAEAAPPATEPTHSAESGKKEFHKNLMEHAVYATSTSTKVTSETEICYRGRCIRSEDLPANHKLV